ncbi:MAG: hypothetical protein R2856_03285 [Caldilineaceae bacterium]
MLLNTVYFTVTIVPLQLAFGLILAVALNQAIGVEIYRLIYFMPVVTTIVAAALVFPVVQPISACCRLGSGIGGSDRVADSAARLAQQHILEPNPRW